MNLQSGERRLIIALDFAGERDTLAMLERLDPGLCRVKVGKELFTRCGPDLVRRIQTAGFDVFLDLKFHDIPNTVAGAVAAAAELGVWMVNVHATGGREMLQAARRATEGSGTLLTAVTVLTSLSGADLHEVGVADDPQVQVLRLARLALDAGLDGVVCSAMEVLPLREAFGPAPLLVTPGIRPAGDAVGDQVRVATPASAIAQGSSYLVLGRPITRAADPLAKLRQVLDEIASS